MIEPPCNHPSIAEIERQRDAAVARVRQLESEAVDAEQLIAWLKSARPAQLEFTAGLARRVADAITLDRLRYKQEIARLRARLNDNGAAVSDATIDDVNRTGDDLLARISELTPAERLDGGGNGWRYLLLACKCEIERLHAAVSKYRAIASQIQQELAMRPER